MKATLANFFGYLAALAAFRPKRDDTFKGGTPQKRARVAGVAKPAGNKLARMAAEARLTPHGIPAKEPANKFTSRRARKRAA